MKTKILTSRRIVWEKHGFKNLLGWLLIYLLIGPFLQSMPYADTVVTLFLTVVLFSAVYTVNQDRRLLSVAIVLLVLTLAMMWLARLGILNLSPLFYAVVLAVYLGTLIFSFYQHLIVVKHVTSNVICAALCLYLMLGMLWGDLYYVLELCVPGSFQGELLESVLDPYVLVHYLNYFSFVTLSTLGYGDITPQTQGAAALCQAEAILGQFFVVVLVARLVGLQVAQEVATEK